MLQGHIRLLLQVFPDFLLPGGSDSKAFAYNAGILGSILGFGRSPAEGMAIHSSILANPPQKGGLQKGPHHSPVNISWSF